MAESLSVNNFIQTIQTNLMAEAYVIMLRWQKRKMRKPLRDILQRLFLWKKEGGQMPRKPKKPCAYPSCPNLTEGRYCPEHQTKVNSEYEKHGRDPRTKKRYGRAWKRIRDKYVQEHPFCELCFQRGVIVPVEEVHHKKPLSEGGTHDRSNLIALCKSCHSRIHANRGDRWHNQTAAP